MNELQLAVLLLQVFGYVNAKEEHITVLESGNNKGCTDYILIYFCDKLIKFNRNDKNTQWAMRICEE